MNILLTNDDGIYAPGLRALRQELQNLGQVTVVAPATEQSAAGHSVTLLVPLLVQEVFDEKNDFIGWAVEGRPADCVKLALLELLPDPVDLVVSGLNAGANAGINVLYSGTVAAAIEAAFFHRVAIACSLSCTRTRKPDFAAGARFARMTIEKILTTNPRPGALFNVNIPDLNNAPPRGIHIVPQNVAPYVEKFDRRIDPRGRTYFWMSADFGCPEPHQDTDEFSLRDGFISVTPLQFDLTDQSKLETLTRADWDLP